MPFGWGAADSGVSLERLDGLNVRHQCLSAGGLLTPFPPSFALASDGKSPMPFGWGAADSTGVCFVDGVLSLAVTNAFRLGGC